MKRWDRIPWSLFFESWALPALSHSSFTYIKRLFSSSSLATVRVVSCAYLRLLIFLPAILIPPCASSIQFCSSFSLAFHTLYSAHKLFTWTWWAYTACWIPFPIWNQTVVPCLVLNVASWPTYRFLRRQIRWSGTPNSFRIFHSLLWSTQRLWCRQ